MCVFLDAAEWRRSLVNIPIAVQSRITDCLDSSKQGSGGGLLGRGWEFYTGTRMWHPEGDVNVDGLQVVTKIYWEQTQSKGPVPSAVKYVDQSYLRERLNGLNKR